MTFTVRNFTICSHVTFHYKRKQTSLTCMDTEALFPTKHRVNQLFNRTASDRQKDKECMCKTKTPNINRKKNKIDYLKGAWLEFHPLPFSYPSTQSPQSGEKKSPIVCELLKQ